MSDRWRTSVRFRSLGLERHAEVRMQQRGLRRDAVEAVLTWGREAAVRGAVIFAIGRREIDAARRERVDLSDLHGVHVVCVHGRVRTVYRNADLRGLRRDGGRRPRRRDP